MKTASARGRTNTPEKIRGRDRQRGRAQKLLREDELDSKNRNKKGRKPKEEGVSMRAADGQGKSNFLGEQAGTLVNEEESCSRVEV